MQNAKWEIMIPPLKTLKKNYSAIWCFGEELTLLITRRKLLSELLINSELFPLAGLTPAPRTVVSSESSEPEGVHASRVVRDHHRKDWRKAVKVPHRLQAELHGASAKPNPALADAVHRRSQCICSATTRHQRHARGVQLRNCAAAAARARRNLRRPVQHRGRGHRARRWGDIHEGESHFLFLWRHSRSLEQNMVYLKVFVETRARLRQ